MKKAILLSIILIFVPNFNFAGDNLPLGRECFSLEGSSEDITTLIEAVFHQLKSSGIMSPGFPVYSRTEIVGEYTKPHILKAVPVASAKLSDSILISEGKFITFRVWGQNARLAFATDRVYLLKEKDERAIQNGLKGIEQYKYIEVCYANVMPTTETGHYGGDFSDANKTITLVRKGLLKAGSKKVKCH